MRITRRFTRHLLVLLRSVLIGEAILLAIVLGLCWLAGLRDGYDLGMTLQITGGVVFAVGPFSLLGGLNVTCTSDYDFAATAGPSSALERAQQHYSDISGGVRFVLSALIMGPLTVFIGAVVQSIM